MNEIDEGVYLFSLDENIANYIIIRSQILPEYNKLNEEQHRFLCYFILTILNWVKNDKLFEEIILYSILNGDIKKLENYFDERQDYMGNSYYKDLFEIKYDNALKTLKNKKNLSNILMELTNSDFLPVEILKKIKKML